MKLRAVLVAAIVTCAGCWPVFGPTDRQLRVLRMCESGGRYTVHNPSGKYHGAYQFDLATWRSAGGTGDPHAASPAEQDFRVRVLHKSRGWAPWPVCGLKAKRA